MPVKQQKDWITKTNAYTLWQKINEYVEAYVAANLTDLHTDWIARWHSYYKFLQKSKTPFTTTSILVTGEDDSTVNDVLTHIISLIPKLEDYLEILEVTEKGSITYFMRDYDESPFKKHVKANPKNQQKVDMSINNDAEPEEVNEIVIEEEELIVQENPFEMTGIDTDGDNNDKLDVTDNTVQNANNNAAQEVKNNDNINVVENEIEFDKNMKLRNQSNDNNDDDEEVRAANLAAKTPMDIFQKVLNRDTSDISKNLGDELNSEAAAIKDSLNKTIESAKNAIKNLKYTSMNIEQKFNSKIATPLRAATALDHTPDSSDDDLLVSDEKRLMKEIKQVKTQKHDVNSKLNELQNLLDQNDWQELMQQPQYIKLCTVYDIFRAKEP